MVIDEQTIERIQCFTYIDILMNCFSGAAAEFVEKDVLESYCWMYSSWNIPAKYKGACSSSQGDHSPQSSDYKVSVVYNSYYQWVPLYLVFLVNTTI